VHRRELVPPLTTLLVGALLVGGTHVLWPSTGCSSEEIAAMNEAIPSVETVQVVVLSSSNKGALMEEMACRFERTAPKVAGQPVDVRIVSESSGSAIDKISSGELKPDVWAPASSSWVSMLQLEKPDLIPPGVAPSIAQSPQVIAMPKPLAERLGWPNAQMSWKRILDFSTDPTAWKPYAEPGSGAFKLGKTNPLYSTSGLNATVATYAAATGRSNDLTMTDIENRKVLDFVKGVDAAVVHYAPTSVDFLRNLRAHDDLGDGEEYVSAILLEEKSVWDYNQGNPSGDPTTLGDVPPPHTPLVAFYPSDGAIVADHPYVILKAEWVTDAEAAAGDEFLRFLQEPEQQQRFQALGFRDRTGAPGPAIDLSNGLIAKAPTTIVPPDKRVLTQIRMDWHQYRQRARVLILMDVSGSMSGDSKLKLAQRAVLNGLKQLVKDDKVGLWTFTPPAAGPAGYVEDVAIKRLSENAKELRNAVKHLQADGSTHLYSAVEAASSSMQHAFDPARINGIILLSDGRNEDPANTDRDAAIRAVAPVGVDGQVRVFTIAYGDLADTATLSEIARSSQGTAYKADPTTIDRVFAQVVANL
jgi:Ca-activated chloride channel homolog